MKPRVDTLSPAVQERLTTLLVQGGHLNHPLRLQAHVETEIKPDQIALKLAESLPAHMIPDQIITSAALPRLPNGKLDRSTLQTPIIEAQPHTPRDPVAEACDSEVLETLRQIWADVLGSDEIYNEDNFFEMGGDSLLSISIVSRAREAGIELLPSDLFDYPSLADLAAQVAIPNPDHALSAVADGPLNLSRIGEDEATQPIFLLNANRKMLDSLNEQLTPRRTLHLISLHWDSGQVDKISSIEAFADEMLKSVRAIQPEGPYSIGGFSIGAVAAHEIARTLTSEGTTVSDLILIDPPENPDLFASTFNKDHVFQRTSDETMTLPRRLRYAAASGLARICRHVGMTVPHKFQKLYAAAAYFTASKRYSIDAPSVPVIIVRRKATASTSMWARPDDCIAFNEVDCSHEEFHRDPAAIHTWTGLLAQSLDR